LLTDIRQVLEQRRISSNILTATGPVRDVLWNGPPDGWEVEQPRLWSMPGISGPFTIGNPIPGAFEGSQLGSIPSVARCTSIIVDSLSGATPWKVYRGRDQLETPDWISDPQALRLDGRVVDPASVPFAPLSHVDFWSSWLTDALWWGDGLVWAPSRDSNGAPRPPMALIHPFDWSFREGAYYAGDRYLPATELIHLRGPGPIVGRRGVGAFQRFAAELGYALTIKDYAHSIFYSGIPSGYLRVTKEGLTQEKADELSMRWDAKHGTGNRRVAVLNATTEFKELTWSPVDAALKEVMQANLNEIANAFGVPGYFIGAGGTDPNTYANLETRRQDLVMFTLLPWTSRIEAVLDAQFPRGVELKVVLDGLLRGTTKDRYEAHNLATGGAAWKTPDEVRDIEDLPPMTIPTPEVTA
jgi:HK97 family phage portal protein